MQPRRLRLTKRAKIFIATSAVLAATASVTVAQAGEDARKCGAFETITMGKYYINNNLWGQNDGTGTQCVWDNSRNGNTISWGTDYSWTSKPGEENSVKSYSSSVLGWHWGWKVDKASTELPVRVGDRKPINTRWEFSVSSNPGTMNVAYDLWLHNKNNADWPDQPTDELMIWLNRQGGAGPLGSKVATVSLGGATWDLYEGDIGWKVHSFVRTSNTTKATLNLDDFTHELVRRNLLSNSKYISGIEAGTEVFRGTGRLDTKAYSVDVT
ncbi:GH12 family glycosyl hydrolase domain-containing protein [Streptomyces sp. KR80]|uniref:GH12 family glycosyl hydrolase domain-containing protein n=1 Tax=Streptomyces sp. KR80 TaxID=3457426 RepID=UPI003FCFAEFC